MNAVLLGVMAYVAIQLAVGMLVSRRVRSQSDFLLAGRRLGYGLATFTIFATWFGAETCVGAAGAIYEHGISAGAADPFGYAACLLLLGAFFAVPLWRRKLTTLADLFRHRYSPEIERFAVLLIVPTSLLWAAAQLRAFGQVITAISGMEIFITTTIAAAVVIIYTSSGGLMADAITDLVQGIALTCGLGLLFYIVARESGGAGASLALVPSERLRIFGAPDTSRLAIVEAWAVPVCGSLLAQEAVSRVLAAKSPVVARRACFAATALYLAVGLIPVYIGLVGAASMPGLESPEQIIPRMAEQYLGTVGLIVVAGALVSAILSTVDSALLAASSLVSQNIVAHVWPRLRDRTVLRFSRGGVAFFGVLAWILALRGGSVFQLVEEASSFGSAGIFVIGVLGLFTRFGGAAAALAALAGGVGVWIWGAYIAGFEHPYLASLAAALGGYAIVGTMELRGISVGIFGRWKPIREVQ